MIRFDDIEVTFGEHVAIPKLDLQIEQGDFFTLLGPSGCGKTTALRTLAGFIDPSRGEIYIEGAPATRLPSEKRRVGMVFQNYALFPSMTVGENIGFGLKVRKHSRADIERMTAEIAAQVELTSEQLAKNVSELSGGQQQRVAIARAIVTSPMLLLADEPTGNLDTATSRDIMNLLVELNREDGITIAMVTHEPDMAAYCRRQIRIVDGKVQHDSGEPGHAD